MVISLGGVGPGGRGISTIWEGVVSCLDARCTGYVESGEKGTLKNAKLILALFFLHDFFSMFYGPTSFTFLYATKFFSSLCINCAAGLCAIGLFTDIRLPSSGHPSMSWLHLQIGFIALSNFSVEFHDLKVFSPSGLILSPKWEGGVGQSFFRLLHLY